MRDPPRPGEGGIFDPPSRERLVAAYRDGLGLVAVILVTGGGGTRLMHAGDEPPLAAGESVEARWWCKSAEQAEWLVEAVARMAGRSEVSDASQLSHALGRAAKRLGITLRSDADVTREADAVIARLEQEIAAEQRAGALKCVNRAYRDYRLAASARGEKVLRYAQWMERYKVKLMREIAHNLRSL